MSPQRSADATLSIAAFRHRSVVLITLAFAWLATSDFSVQLLASGGGLAQGPARRPDVIILLTDQQRADAFGAAGATDVRTPAMDRLARQGVHFTKAFTPTPQCSPARAALLTGRYPHRTGVMGNVGGASGDGAG